MVAPVLWQKKFDAQVSESDAGINPKDVLGLRVVYSRGLLGDHAQQVVGRQLDIAARALAYLQARRCHR